MATTYTIIELPVGSLPEAHEIAGRLTGAGFARNSISIVARPNGPFHVAVHTRAYNRARVMRAAEGSRTFQTAAYAALIGLGAAALAGGIWALWRNSDAVADYYHRV